MLRAKAHRCALRDGRGQPSKVELEGALYRGAHIGRIASKLADGSTGLAGHRLLLAYSVCKDFLGQSSCIRWGGPVEGGMAVVR